MGYRKPYYDENHKLVRYTPKDALEDAFTFLRRFFAFRNIKHAFISSVKGFKEFAVFFAALFFIQSMFWTVWLVTDSRAKAAEKEALSCCEYTVIYEGMTEDEWASCFNKNFRIANELEEDERGYVDYDIEKYYNGLSEVRLRLSFRLTSDTVKACNSFASRYSIKGEEVSVYYTERVTYKERVKDEKTKAVLITLAVGALSAIILLVLFIIRTNQYKFTYGIYMAFGADFEKLLETAAWELFAVAILTFIPSMLLSVGIYSLFLKGTGGVVGFGFGRVIWAFVWLLCVVIVAVIPAVKILSKKMPMSLIIAGDNSNFVSSPRVSFRIFGKSFPYHYELFGFIRYRKYYILLLVSAVIFTTLFSCGLFLSDMTQTNENYDRPQFTVEFPVEGIDELDLEAVRDIEGVKNVGWYSETSATLCKSHVVLTKKQASGISSKTVNAQQTGMKADNNFRYLRLDEQLVTEATERGLWQVEGDLSSVLTQENTVAVSCNISNRQALNFNVGDTITLAVFEMQGAPIDYSRTDKKYILSRQVSDYYFNFIECTIGAIIDTGSTDDEYYVAISPDMYTEITGDSGEVEYLEVFLEDREDHEQAAEVKEKLLKAVSGYEGYILTDNGSDYAYTLANGASAYRGIIYGAILVLLITPLVWFYSQMMFGTKRGKEIYMLSAMGATDSDLSRLFLFSGGVLTVLASLATALLGSLLCRTVYKTVNEFLPSLGIGEGIRYTYKFSWLGLLACVLISSLSAICSTYYPFVKYRKNRDRIARISSGDEN